MKKVRVLFLAVAFGITSTAFGQDDNDADHNIVISIPEVALLDVEGGTSINLGGTAPTEAGDPITFGSTDNSLWINYSSIIGSTTEPSRAVSVAVSSGTLPGGLDLKVQAGNDAGSGDGTVGTPSAQLTLSSTGQSIITGIGSCYTGDGANNGHQLTYTLDLASGGNYADLDFDDATTVTVTYTLSDN